MNSTLKPSPSQEHFTIVGAGPVGSLLATYLAQIGYSSDLFERRPDMRQSHGSEGKSINLAVSTRGLYALREIGLEDHILNQAIPMRGRMIHSITGELNFQPYGISDRDCIYSMSRSSLNKALMTRAELTGKAKIHFQKRLIKLDLKTRALQFSDGEVVASKLIAADGASSIVRHQMMAQPGYTCSQDYLEYGYKELTIPPGPNHTFQIERGALHIWPRGSYMLIALPNIDGSFTCTLFLANQNLDAKGETPSFSNLNTREKVATFFSTQFPDIIPLIPNLIDDFFENPTGHMVTVKCSPWNKEDHTLLIGDAAHAIVPFFGQGMNCGFEDCTLLIDLWKKLEDWNLVFRQFSSFRRQSTDRIADMAVENFFEMRDQVGHARFLMEKAVESILQKSFPGEYVSRYSLVTFSRAPYEVAYEVGILTRKIINKLCQNMTRIEDLDLQLASQLIRKTLKPYLSSQKGFNYGP